MREGTGVCDMSRDGGRGVRLPEGWDPQWVVQDVGADVVDVDAVEGRAVLFSVRKRSRGHIYRSDRRRRSPSSLAVFARARARRVLCAPRQGSADLTSLSGTEWLAPAKAIVSFA